MARKKPDRMLRSWQVVSTAAVSNVINNGHMVKDETAERVWAAIEKLNYRPDMVARSLTTQRTMQIGVLLKDIQNPFYGEIVKYIEAAANGTTVPRVCLLCP